MDMRDFERSNELCKPGHFAPPTRSQRRVAREAIYAAAQGRPSAPRARLLLAVRRVLSRLRRS
jgi:hypothetical protein